MKSIRQKIKISYFDGEQDCSIIQEMNYRNLINWIDYLFLQEFKITGIEKLIND